MITSGSVTITSSTVLPIKLFTATRGIDSTVVIGCQVVDTSTNNVLSNNVPVVVGDATISLDTAHNIVHQGVLAATPYTLPDFTGDLWVYPEWNTQSGQEVLVTFTAYDIK